MSESKTGNVIQIKLDTQQQIDHAQFVSHELRQWLGPAGVNAGRLWYRRRCQIWKTQRREHPSGAIGWSKTQHWVMRLYFRDARDHVMAVMKFSEYLNHEN